MNTTSWRNLKIKVIPTLILTEIFPLMHETLYLKHCFLLVSRFLVRENAVEVFHHYSVYLDCLVGLGVSVTDF